MINIAVKLIRMNAPILVNNTAKKQLEFQMLSGEKAFWLFTSNCIQNI